MARRLYVLFTLVSFALLVYLDSKNFFGRGGRQQEKREKRLRRQATRLRERLIRLGPTFIKVGQMLGTRADLLPIEYVDELSRLQDEVPPFANAEAMALIAAELGRPLDEVFAQMGEAPVASASLGQVYRAKLRAKVVQTISDGRAISDGASKAAVVNYGSVKAGGNGKAGAMVGGGVDGIDVAVKIQRPNLAVAVAYDLELLRWLARYLNRYPQLFPGTDWLGAIDEFDRVIHEEMDYRREAANAEEFRHNFRDWQGIHVPRIHHEVSTARLLVMEFIEGTKVNDLERLRAEGHSPRRLNELIYRSYFKQLFEDGFFHADPHPGNLRVMRDGRLAIFDFGMAGRVSEELQRKIIEAFFHLYNRDVEALVEDMISLGFLAPNADVAAIRAIVADVIKRKLNLQLKEVRFKELTYDLAPVIYEHPITTPSHFTYLMRAIMTLEGVSIVMNPEFNFFEVARPYVKDFLFRRESSRLRQMALSSLRDARTGKFEWGRLWTMAKMAYALYLGGD